MPERGSDLHPCLQAAREHGRLKHQPDFSCQVRSQHSIKDAATLEMNLYRGISGSSSYQTYTPYGITSPSRLETKLMRSVHVSLLNWGPLTFSLVE